MSPVARLLAVALLFPLAAAAKPAPKPPPADVQATRDAMAKLVAHLRALQPFLVSRAAFADPANDAVIRSLLTGLVEASGGLDHVGTLKAPGFALSAQVFRDHVSRTARVFETGPREYARAMARATLEGCISCHSQLPGGDRAFAVEPTTLGGAPLDRAELLFATRRFDAALEAYDAALELVTNTPGSDLGRARNTADQALRRKLAIQLRVRRDPVAARSMLQADLARKNLPSALAPVLQRWIDELGEKSLAPGFDPKKAPAKAVIAWAHKATKGDVDPNGLFERPGEAARYLLVSGVLLEFLAKNPAAKKDTEALRLLSRADRALGGDFVFSLGDMYLEECIRRAPRTPGARACLSELKEATTFEFSGSGGTEIPADVRARLDALTDLTTGKKRK